MCFSLNKLKKLYENYVIIENRQGQVVIAKNDIDEVHISDINLVNSVKFAYAWVYVNSKEGSNKFLEVDAVENYEDAFNENSEYLYDVIIEISKEFMETTGNMINCEALINFVLEDEDVYDNAIKVIQNLYLNNEIYHAFENWIIYIVNNNN